MRRSPKTTTIQDVARVAGVSVSTVSRVLNGKVDVAPETIERVRNVVRDLNYASSLAARGMRSHRTNVIGLIIPDVAQSYCHAIMTGVNHVIAEMEKDLIVYTSGTGIKQNLAQNERSYVSLLNGGITDGVIVVAPFATDFMTHAPLVIVDPSAESPACPSVSSNNREGALAALNYLTCLGHRRIASILGRMELASAIQRLQGYCDGLAAAGLPYDPSLVVEGDYTIDLARECARKLLAKPDRPTAIFAANDMTALGVYQAAQEAGLCIPKDLSVVGFDNLPESASVYPRLTTVDQFIEEMGTVAAKMVVKLIHGEKLSSNTHVIQTELIIRDSCSSIL